MKKITRAAKQKRYAADKKRYNNRLKLERNNKNNVDGGVDRISLLPDKILASVLSRLRLRDAIATSILSTRWRHLYTKVDSLYIPPITVPKSQEDFSKLVDTINHTLDLFKSNMDFKGFGLNMHHCFQGADLERWLGFALSRKVETISINMCYDTKSFHYTLPLSNLIRTHLPGLKSLKNLHLSGIKVEDLEVELLLSSFPLLESLTIRNSERLKNVSVVVGGHELKKLSMCSLDNLESITISDMPNLVSFLYYGHGTYSLRLANVPKLTELHITENGVNLLHTIPSSILDQLRILEIYANPTLLTIDHPSYKLKNLKQLDLKVHMIQCYSNHQLQKFFPLIEACTSLETLDVKLIWIEKGGSEKLEIKEVRDLVHMTKQLSRNLKRFDVSGYTGSAEELKFALFVMNNAAALEQMTVETCGDHPTKQRMAIARARKELKPVAPSSLNLVIKNISKRSKH